MKKLMAYLLSMVTIYLVIAFIMYELNIFDWPWYIRLLWVIWSMLVIDKISKE